MTAWEALVFIACDCSFFLSSFILCCFKQQKFYGMVGELWGNETMGFAKKKILKLNLNGKYRVEIYPRSYHFSTWHLTLRFAFKYFVELSNYLYARKIIRKITYFCICLLNIEPWLHYQLWLLRRKFCQFISISLSPNHIFFCYFVSLWLEKQMCPVILLHPK